MAGELLADVGITGLTVYFHVYSSISTIWNGTSLVTYVSANYSTYTIAGSELGTSGVYVGNMPAVAAGTYSAVAKIQAGASPAETDTSIADGTIPWDGTKTLTVLSPSGLDLVTVESGLNARQSLSIIASASAGVLAGAASTTVTIAAAGVPATNRITATVDASGDRSAVTINPPP